MASPMRDCCKVGMVVLLMCFGELDRRQMLIVGMRKLADCTLQGHCHLQTRPAAYSLWHSALCEPRGRLGGRLLHTQCISAQACVAMCSSVIPAVATQYSSTANMVHIVQHAPATARCSI